MRTPVKRMIRSHGHNGESRWQLGWNILNDSDVKKERNRLKRQRKERR